MKKIILILIVFQGYFCKSQNVILEWAVLVYAQPGVALNIAADQLHVSNSGNIFLGGNFIDTSTSYSNAAVIKLNSSGLQMWESIQLGQITEASLASIALDSNENTYSVGTFDVSNFYQTAYSKMNSSNGSVVWENIFDTLGGLSTWGERNLVTKTNRYFEEVRNGNITIREFDQAGNIIGSFTNDTILNPHGFIVQGFIADDSDNLYVFGIYQDSFPQLDNKFFLKKFNASGNLLWESFYDPTTYADLPYHASVDQNQNVYLTGRVDGGVPGFNASCGTVVFDSTGALKWQHVYRIFPTRLCYGGQVIADDLGNAYLSGYGGDTLNKPVMFLQKYDTSGSIIWTRLLDSATFFNIDAKIINDAQHNIYLTYNRLNSNSGISQRTMKFDTSGAVLWTMDYTGNGVQKVKAIAIDSFNNIYIGGQGFVVKYSQPVSVNELNPPNIQYSIYPNPAKEILNITLKNNITSAQFILYDATGRKVKEQKLNKTATVNVSTLQAGIYFYSIKDKEGKAVYGKVMKE